MIKNPRDLYVANLQALKQAVRVRRVFDQIASSNDGRELERLMFCSEVISKIGSEAKSGDVVFRPPVPSELWKCVIEPSPYSDRPVLTYKYVTAIREHGSVEFNRLFIDRGPVSGELICVKQSQETHLNDLLVTGKRLSKFEAEIVSKAVQSPRFLAS